ncbi:bifunctional glutamate N-acetyltransferase/amino-acid acetyltransferase ArgJ [Parendozoicomonas haliclonae]|uniref:Arginine biosynthesis bifunctional protein ArgJ n=1 Tax=Parendozoicomonas haliclonae TaxID=1960125 RepID=A0A1X7AGX2_9GAMM|nr:bifunctional glutamate N-acetyltransferase/amino-acid acetyltransferase ArgJ [Parendozoicomonas haliclonae]SMA34343.1 Arginine biosynthesis bifunctional protein ArgJ [Parendozoicomonas haliclonae]
MAVGLPPSGDLYPVKGFELGTVKAGVRYPDRKDLVVMRWPESASIAGLFTLNKFCAAPVQLSRSRLNKAPCALVVNTGNANAGTGDRGVEDALSTTAAVSDVLGCEANQVLSFSTGVIGEYLPVTTIVENVPRCVEEFSPDGWWDAAEGIMTTDTHPKGFSVRFQHEGEEFTVTGIAKGSGMIHPNMATMLTYIVTDASIEQELLRNLWKEVVDQTFNRITVDGDTSTNDSAILIATGSVGNQLFSAKDNPLYQTVYNAIFEVAEKLAKALVMDGEGATRFVTMAVEGAESIEQAHTVANTVALSPLVKTALFACDPNWGRILAAAGRAPVDNLDADKIRIWLDDVLIAERGGVAGSYREEAGQVVMDRDAYTIRIDLGLGDKQAKVWTSDLSHDYVTINAEYRT